MEKTNPMMYGPASAMGPVSRYRLDIEHLGGLVAPTSHLLTQPRLLIGRGVCNDVRLCSPLRVVSEYHLMLYQENQRYWVRDIGSKNGTWYNGAPLPQGVSMVLGDGDRLQVGDFQLTFSPLDYPQAPRRSQ